MAYRDSLGALRGQVVIKRAVLHARENEVPAVLRALLPDDLDRTIVELRPAAIAEPDTLETLEKLSVTDAALDGIIAVYDRAIELAPELRACSEDLADPPTPSIPPPWLLEEPRDIAFREAVDERLSLFGEKLERWGDRGYVSRFGLGDFRCLLFVEHDMVQGNVAFYWCSLRVNVPAALPRLQLSVQGSAHDFAKAIGLAREIDTGDPAFDQQYWIKGEARSAALLTPAVRKALLDLPDMRPVLLVEKGVAKLDWKIMWRGYANDALPSAAIDLMQAIRNAIAGS